MAQELSLKSAVSGDVSRYRSATYNTKIAVLTDFSIVGAIGLGISLGASALMGSYAIMIISPFVIVGSLIALSGNIEGLMYYRVVKRLAKELGAPLNSKQKRYFRKYYLKDYQSDKHGLEVNIKDGTKKGKHQIQMSVNPSFELNHAFFGAVTMKGKTLPRLVDADKVVSGSILGAEVAEEMKIYTKQMNDKLSKSGASGFTLTLDRGEIEIDPFNVERFRSIEACYKKDFMNRLKSA